MQILLSGLTSACGSMIWRLARYVPHFIDSMATFNLVNIVDRLTSVSGHIINLVFVDVSRDLVCDLDVAEVCSLSPVHRVVSLKLALTNKKHKL